MYFTSSWDDGHPSDLRLAELMQKHGFKATFFVPITNVEGLPVMQGPALRQLAALAELGSHTHDHVYANRASLAVWAEQVISGKQALEQITGAAVEGFCYPGGKRVPGAVEAVAAAGFSYARSTENLRIDAGRAPMLVPTTIQCFPHKRSTLVKNFMRHGAYTKRVKVLLHALKWPRLQDQLRGLLALAQEQDGVFHLWGHSWELDSASLWPELDSFLAFAAGCVPAEARLSNGQMVHQALLKGPQ